MAKKDMVDVVATAPGWDGFSRRAVGDVFQMPSGVKGRWFDPVEVEKPAPEPEPDPKPKSKKVSKKKPDPDSEEE